MDRFRARPVRARRGNRPSLTGWYRTFSVITRCNSACPGSTRCVRTACRIADSCWMQQAAPARPTPLPAAPWPPNARPGVTALPSASRGLHAPSKAGARSGAIFLTCRSRHRAWICSCCRIRSNSPAIRIRLLREAERVLMPEGQLIILGFNSLSLWGARQIVRQSGR